LKEALIAYNSNFPQDIVNWSSQSSKPASNSEAGRGWSALWGVEWTDDLDTTTW